MFSTLAISIAIFLSSLLLMDYFSVPKLTNMIFISITNLCFIYILGLMTHAWHVFDLSSYYIFLGNYNYDYDFFFTIINYIKSKTPLHSDVPCGGILGLVMNLIKDNFINIKYL